MLSEEKTVKGRTLAWLNGPLQADDPAAAWHGLLKARGLTESDPFFAPRLADLPDPLAMKDMDKAAQRVAAAMSNGEKIHIFGDFDADGVNGTAILVQALRAAGAEVSQSIPHRADDGHGIGVEPVREAVAAGVKLGISVDTGTTCFDACAEASSHGFDLIVSDHHLPEKIQIADHRDLKGGVTRLKLTDGSRWLDGIVFGANGMGDAIEPGLTVSVIGELQKDTYRGNGAVQFVVKDVML